MRRLARVLLTATLLLAGCGGEEILELEFEDEPIATATTTATEEPLPGDDDVLGGDPAAGSCLAGDEDCTDESFDGQDVTRPVPLVDAEPQGEPIPSGASNMATAQQIAEAAVTGDTTLTVAWDGSPCDVLVDAMVTESDTEVRLFVLAGEETGTEACIQSIQRWTTTVELDAPLGDRELLDISG